jgi:hypothetical protein
MLVGCSGRIENARYESVDRIHLAGICLHVNEQVNECVSEYSGAVKCGEVLE